MTLCSEPILSFPVSEGTQIVNTDTSNTDVEAVLTQMQKGKEQGSSVLQQEPFKRERNYCGTRRELLVID